MVSLEGSRSNVLIICSGNLTGEEKIFLGKVLGSVKLNLSDVALVSLENAPAFRQLKKAGFSKLLLFGVSPSDVGLNIAHSNYRSVDLQGAQILAGESLSALEASETSKALLWKALKKMFL